MVPCIFFLEGEFTVVPALSFSHSLFLSDLRFLWNYRIAFGVLFLICCFFFLFLYSFSEYLGLIVCYQVSLQRDRQGVDEGKGGLGCI